MPSVDLAELERGLKTMGELPDHILMQGMVFHGYVGVLEFEKQNGQPFEIDVTLFCRQLDAVLSDQLVQTINYGEAYALIRQIVESARCDLIERLAGMIAAALLDRFDLAQAAKITVRKPQAPIDGCFTAMGVSIYRERS